MGYVSTLMGDCLSALLVSLVALQLVLVDKNSFRLVNKIFRILNTFSNDVSFNISSPLEPLRVSALKHVTEDEIQINI